jgi:hypothetical protein
MTHSTPSTGGASPLITAIAWLWVLIPFIWGIWQLIIKVVPLFSG